MGDESQSNCRFPLFLGRISYSYSSFGIRSGKDEGPGFVYSPGHGLSEIGMHYLPIFSYNFKVEISCFFIRDWSRFVSWSPLRKRLGCEMV